MGQDLTLCIVPPEKRFIYAPIAARLRMRRHGNPRRANERILRSTRQQLELRCARPKCVPMRVKNLRCRSSRPKRKSYMRRLGNTRRANVRTLRSTRNKPKARLVHQQCVPIRVKTCSDHWRQAPCQKPMALHMGAGARHCETWLLPPPPSPRRSRSPWQSWRANCGTDQAERWRCTVQACFHIVPDAQTTLKHAARIKHV